MSALTRLDLFPDLFRRFARTRQTTEPSSNIGTIEHDKNCVSVDGNLLSYIQDNLTTIVDKWEAIARTLPAAKAMSRLALRDHNREILRDIARHMQAGPLKAADRIAGRATESHRTLQQLAGFGQLVAEFQAMRASVLSSWMHSAPPSSSLAVIEEITRFNEGIDLALAESVESYATTVAASRDMFLGVLGHDLRGPLSSIAMSTQSLAHGELSPEARQRAASRIGLAIKDMRGLIEDLLDLTRSQLGGISIKRAACDLGPLCREAIDLMEASHPEQQFVLTLGNDLIAQADRSKMRQALGNLLGNATQHGDRHQPISLSAAAEADAIVLKVSNQGAPIPAPALQTIFEPLTQLHSVNDGLDERSRGSMGLGLFIVSEIVKGHLGTVTVASDIATGTVFTVTLPRGHDA